MMVCMHLTTPYQHATRRRCSCLLSGTLVKWNLSLFFCFISPTHGEDDIRSSNSTEQPRTAAQGANIAGIGDEYYYRAPHYQGRGIVFEIKRRYGVQLSSSEVTNWDSVQLFPQRVTKDWSKRTASTNHCPTKRSGLTRFIRVAFLRQEQINKIGLGTKPRYSSLH
ncbi:hypothetical protein BDV36DRAFT_189023 [Aspergillus pseudocaelatus]|uniref:Uncharacterized protein n=1 Tax=Aspergillus pseudocaelatus TaxID=1825620 RepID=A0ABQ6WIJ0_9EURO|nr:hypothetical protein BDV36DRAFT_189023 [Aspergillus pseudocaelatus]